MDENQHRLLEVYKRLRKRYGKRAPKQKLSDLDPLEGLIETILSQQNIGVVTHRGITLCAGLHL